MYIAIYWPPTRLHATDHRPLGLVIEPVFHPPHHVLIWPIHQFFYENLTVNSAVGNTHCSPLTHQTGQLILKVYQFGQMWLSLGEFMLTLPNDFTVPHVPRNSFQDYSSITFAGTEMKLTSLELPVSSFGLLQEKSDIYS